MNGSFQPSLSPQQQWGYFNTDYQEQKETLSSHLPFKIPAKGLGMLQMKWSSQPSRETTIPLSETLW